MGSQDRTLKEQEQVVKRLAAMLAARGATVQILEFGRETDAVIKIDGKEVAIECFEYRGGGDSDLNAELMMYPKLCNLIVSLAESRVDLRGLSVHFSVEYPLLRKCNRFGSPNARLQRLATEMIDAIAVVSERLRAGSSASDIVFLSDDAIDFAVEQGVLALPERKFPLAAEVLGSVTCWRRDDDYPLVPNPGGETPGIEHLPGWVAEHVAVKIRKHRARHQRPVWLVIHSHGAPETARAERDDIDRLVEEARREFAAAQANPFERGYWLDQTHGEPVLVRFG